MAAKAKKVAKSAAKKKAVKPSRRKTHLAGRVSKDSAELKAQRKKKDSRKTGVRKTRKQRDVKNKGTASRSVSKSPRRSAAKKQVHRDRKPSSATMTPAPADAGMPAGLPNVEHLA
ncbi:hypothetical protein JY651_11325 [Pyxidicoccus parkwayensis]|uniref:Uncharacterized protein n=1 Tax=Pyxidicoccus parkwayensis TaxID=2813578 RepID=A0ABX7P4Q6_9BACT|nr:hypothetical protein [Pyxidicoccus parkwaysis]QSQ25477.1 hypothetical protein JY651_11325 [Pyxidicoccus parkwaysis]